MTREQLDKLEVQIGQALAKIFDAANLKANKLLNIYGLETQIVYQINKKSEKITKTEKNKV